MCNLCPVLAKRNEELQAELAQLKQELYQPDWEAPTELALTPSQERLLAAMVKHDRTLPTWHLFEASRTRLSYAEDLDGNLVSVMISHMRRKLRPFGLNIETVYARGYRLTPETRAKLLNWPTAATPQKAA